MVLFELDECNSWRRFDPQVRGFPALFVYAPAQALNIHGL